ncbi:MAG: response regulator [Deltaproteobacteria bacterium]|nr:response regulator [Deltaproteobacteria bacterium]
MRPRPMRIMDHREFPLLYVDDEPDNLRIFELTFKKEFSILTATSAEEGLRLLNENPVAVVLSDQRMPGMTGVEFLARVREVDPKTIRILVTAYGDAETLGVAINDGSIYRYIPKPWEPDDVRLTLRRAIESYALDRERDALISELSLLNQLSRALHRELDIDKLLALLLEAAHRELGFDGATLLFFEKAGRALRWGGMEPEGGVAKQVRGIELGPDSAPDFVEGLRAGEVQHLFMSQVDDVERPLREWLTEVSAEEILVVPLVGKQEVIGALAIDNRSGGRRFGADDRTLLDGLATQAVIAIENARLVEDLKHTRIQVQRADRLGTLGTLAAGLAHEINNPLVSIHTFLSLAPEKVDSHDEAFWGDYHSLATQELERIRGLVSTMSRLAHGGAETAEPSAVVLEELARDALTLLQREVNAAAVDLTLECDPRTPAVLGLRPHLHQVLLNLLHNALHATPKGGSIRVVIGPDSTHPDEMACITVEDTGCGIDEENVERVFDPFFTTKDPDMGTGLGLMISHRIVEDHGGSIDVRSRKGEGSRFSVRLPVKGLESR